ncbi:MAG: patatin-like phospholipase family protein [Bacteroidales bacterium]|nr:patatin-like phospholipase family protein [Bacteroidales bacterium]
MYRKRLPYILLFLCFIPHLLLAQTESPVRPKIGYVLSGGGAKGMAHVGVLKVLEELGLEPDYITGTSMGSIMGGLYAIGYSADEIAHIIETIDWSTVLTNEIPSSEVIMRRKHEYGRYILEIPIYDGKPELPAGLIEGQKLSELFSELSWRVAGVNDFHDFPYPFTGIGTDILRGEKVLMRSGDLSSAMRASMAIPSVFTAVVRDSVHILVDGGVMRNFPVQEAIDMGADIIIGVYVGFDSQMEARQLRSLTSVITRTSLLSGAQDVASQVPLVDYMIVPDLEGYSPASFGSGVEIMNRGEEAARARIGLLKALADSVNNLGVPPKRRQLPANDSVFIGDIKVLSVSPALESFVVSRSGIETGQWIHPDLLNKGIDKLFGTLFFEKIEYYFEKMQEGYRLVFRIKEKAHSSIGAALHYDNTFGPGLILNYTLINSLVEGSRLGLSMDISENMQLKAYYDLHLGKKRNFIASLFVTSEREVLPFFSNDVDIGNYHHGLTRAGLGLRQSLGINSHLGTDFYYRYSNLKLSRNIKEVKPELEFLDNFIFRGPELALFYQLNTFDNNLYPTRGSRMYITYRQAYSTQFITKLDFPDSLDIQNRNTSSRDPYWHLTVDLESFIPLGKKMSFNSEFAIGLSANDKPFPDNYYVGGYRYNQRSSQVAFVGLQSHELLQGNYVKEKFALQVEAIPNLFLSALYNLVFVSNDHTTFLDDIISWNNEARYMGVGAGFTYKTPIGPVSVFLGSRTDLWNPAWYTNIGFTF